MRTIYLDHAATTPVRPEVVEAMAPFYAETFANPSSLHLPGQKARRALEEARETVASCLGAGPDEIVFTSGGTESDNLALRGALSGAGRKRLITSSVEHSAVLNCCRALEAEGVETIYLPVDGGGAVKMETLEESLASRLETGRKVDLVSVMLGNNETGALQPVKEIAAALRGKGIPLHTDAVQAFGKMEVAVDALGVDLLSISAHKFNGPKGVGALYIRRGTQLSPVLLGGRQERALRAGTENVPAIVGLAKAMELARSELPDSAARLAALRDRLERGILDRLPGARLNGDAAPSGHGTPAVPGRRLPHILNIAFEGVEGDALLLALDVRGIAASTGSACNAGSLEGSHVLKAMGVEPALARGSIRFSLGRGNTDEEMDRTADALCEIVPQLRRAALR